VCVCVYVCMCVCVCVCVCLCVCSAAHVERLDRDFTEIADLHASCTAGVRVYVDLFCKVFG